MKKNLLALSLVAVVSLALASQAFSSNAQKQEEDRDFSERDEINQTYELSSGARVEVRGINGTVDIETANGSTAEVHIVRSARTREELNNRRIIVEHTGNSLIIRPEKENERGGDRNVRQRVMLKLPRAVDLSVSGVNGRTTVGEVDGPVRISGINGAVEVGQAVGYSDISGVNGRVRVNIARLSERGIQVSGINGGVELRFAEELNADLDVTGINGSVNADMPNVTVIGKLSRQNFRAKIGSGGTPITVRGVNGSVRLSRVGSAG